LRCTACSERSSQQVGSHCPNHGPLRNRDGRRDQTRNGIPGLVTRCLALWVGLLCGLATDGAEPIRYAAPSFETTRDQVLLWARSHGRASAEQLQWLERRWSDSAAVSIGKVDLLSLIVESRAELDPTWQELVRWQRGGAPADRSMWEPCVKAADTDSFWGPNARLAVGVLLVEHRWLDEALEVLQTVDPGQTVDPASLLFAKAVAAAGLLDMPTAQDALNRLLTQTAAVPARYRSAATLMQTELQGFESESLDAVSRLMSESERRLELGRAGESVQDVQEKIVTTLDELIKKIEASGGGGGGGGGAGGQSNQSDQPAEDSTIKGSTAPGETDSKKFSKEGRWGDLPEKQQAQAKNLINRQFPGHYRQAVEMYFKKLSNRPAGPQK
jgi:hypothetical protein